MTKEVIVAVKGLQFMEEQDNTPVEVITRGEKNVTYYYTPYGSILIGVEGKRIALSETDERIEIQADYGMEVNYEYLADCSITVCVTAPGAQDFHF